MPPDFKPYLLRAYYEWCADRGHSPYLAVAVDSSCKVPKAHVRDGQIVLDISMDATGSLELGNEAITFQARFGGIAQSLYVPIHRILGIFPEGDQAQGLYFEVSTVSEVETDATPLDADATKSQNPSKPRITRVK